MTPNQIIKQVSKIIRKYFGNEAEIYLFGSQAKGNAKYTSDVDIAVESHSVKKEQYHLFSLIRQDIDKLRTLRKVDVINLSETTSKFKKHIFKYAIPL